MGPLPHRSGLGASCELKDAAQPGPSRGGVVLGGVPGESQGLHSSRTGQVTVSVAAGAVGRSQGPGGRTCLALLRRRGCQSPGRCVGCPQTPQAAGGAAQRGGWGQAGPGGADRVPVSVTDCPLGERVLSIPFLARKISVTEQLMLLIRAEKIFYRRGSSWASRGS